MDATFFPQGENYELRWDTVFIVHINAVVVLFFSPFCRLLVGFIVRLKIFDPPTKEQMYDDEDFWEVRSQLHFKSLNDRCQRDIQNLAPPSRWLNKPLLVLTPRPTFLVCGDFHARSRNSLVPQYLRENKSPLLVYYILEQT